jgi:hypothetical protein
LAVVAVASRVAQERQVTLGGSEVGYHVGQANHSLSNTKLLFTSAGILLQDLRAQGVEALTKYRVVLIDECHERSSESDLVLVLVKSMLKTYPNKKIHIILMSATFDHGRYRSYFAGVPGCERVDTITLETAGSFESFYERVETLYLESILQSVLPDRGMHRGLQRSMRLDPDKDLRNNDGGKTLSDDLLLLILSLVEHLHDQEPLEGVFVIFAPTYRHLEQIYNLLEYEADGCWNLGVLHSSVDMEYCLRSMQQEEQSSPLHNKRRKILLASAIADSSVTIPGVTCIIDLCRALQVRWDESLKTYIPKTVWASKSICDQRRGRTGRTCAGRVFRLLPQGFFITRLETFEIPQLCLCSCRDEVLNLLCCSTTQSDPAKLLQSCLDPPSNDVVQGSLRYLESIGACVKNKKNKYVPSKLGELLATLPFMVEDSHTIVRGGQLGLFHETLALRAIFTHKPSPIVHHFGDNDKNEAVLRRFYPSVDPKKSTSVNLAHLSAFCFWDITWNSGRLQTTLRQFFQTTLSETPRSQMFMDDEHLDDFHNEIPPRRSGVDYSCDVWKWTPSLEEKHSEWCRKHEINPTSVRSIADVIVNTWKVFYLARFEPEWLRSTKPTPAWRRFPPSPGRDPPYNMLRKVYGQRQATLLVGFLTSLCERPTQAYRDALHFHGLHQDDSVVLRNKAASTRQPTACLHFLQGHCSFGSKCRNSHSPFATKAPCRYFMSGHCTRGNDCIYSHDIDEQIDSSLLTQEKKDPMSALLPLDTTLQRNSCLDWFRTNSSRLLLVGDGTFEFSHVLAQLGCRPAFSSCLESGYSSPTQGSSRLYGVDATRIHVHETILSMATKRLIRCVAWNFPFTGVEEDDEINESLILGTFLSLQLLSLLIPPNPQTDDDDDDVRLRFTMTLQGDQFSRWNVLRSALRTGWELFCWGPFDHSNEFPGYSPRRANGQSFPVSCPRMYEFVPFLQNSNRIIDFSDSF